MSMRMHKRGDGLVVEGWDHAEMFATSMLTELRAGVPASCTTLRAGVPASCATLSGDVLTIACANATLVFQLTAQDGDAQWGRLVSVVEHPRKGKVGA